MCRLEQATQAALDARCAAADALLSAALKVHSVVVNPPMNIVLEPSEKPLSAIYDPTLWQPVPADMLNRLREVD